MITTTTPDVQFAGDLLLDLVQAFTRHPDELRVDGTALSSGIALVLETGNHFDYRKIVGTGGKHIRALQTIMAAHGEKIGEPVNVTLMQFEGALSEGRIEPRDTAKRSADWEPGSTVALLDRVLAACLPELWDLNVVKTGGLWTMEIFPRGIVPRGTPGICERPEFPAALHAIFHAIGKTSGADVHVQFAKTEVLA